MHLYLLEFLCLLYFSQGWNFEKNATRDSIVYSEVFFDGEPLVTDFTCQDKVPGGTYADIQTFCEMYHTCLLTSDGKLVDYKLFCENGTAFNEERQTCEEKGSFECTSGTRELRRVRRQPPSYSYHNLPKTNFSCLGKILGGYYADPETDCQMFHICTPGENNNVIDIMFLCGNGTVFDQRKLVCERYGLVDCEDGTSYLDEEKQRLKEDEEHRKLANVEITRIKF